METIKCKECGKEINKKAEICPNCGCRVKSNTLKIIIICLGVIIVLFSVFFGAKYIINAFEEKAKTTENSTNKEKEIVNRVKSITGKYKISNDEYKKFIELLKKDGYSIEVLNNDDISDYEFEIKEEDISSASGLDGVGLDYVAFGEFDNNLYILLYLKKYLNIGGISSRIALKVEDNKLIGADASKIFDKESILNNYNLIINKIS